MTDSNHPPSSRGQQPATSPPGRRRRSSGPGGKPRAGRRDTNRRRQAPRSTAERLRAPLLALVVIAVVVGVGAFVFASAAAPAYACTSIDTVQAAASGELGQIQPDMGNAHVQPGDKVTYPICPPASGKHVNQAGFGPLEPKVYGPDDQSVPNGWVHNLEHGALVLLYSCDKGACDTDADLQQLRDFAAGFPNSPICGLPAGIVGPVVARFEDMPTRYTALLWNRALYLDTLNDQEVYDFYTRYGERISSDGTWLAPPEPQCAAPTASPVAQPGSAAPSPAAS